MKTLKKTLCLVLAVVMAVGVLMIPASAAGYDEFTDKDKIEHEEAVKTLNGMKIIDGKENSNFDPTGTLTRAEAAKIVVYAKIGKTSADKLTGTASKFSDVAGHWAAGYISYAAQLNVLQGNGDGTVEPEGKLTGYALAKMLLVAAGVEGTYIGADWENNVMLAATQNRFLGGIEDIDLSADISRDDAAQMVWNALWYSPKGETTEYVVYFDDGDDEYDASKDTEITTTDDPTTALVLKMANESETKKVGIHTRTISEGSLGQVVYGLANGSDKDAWGRDVKTYTNGKSGNDKVVYASFGADPTASYVNGQKGDKILSDLGLKYGDEATLTVIEDGKTSVDAASVKREKNTTDTNLTTTYGGIGTLVEVFKEGKAVTVYVINTYVHKVVKNDITPYKAATSNTKEEKARLTIDGASIETDAFAKDDIVIYTENKSTSKIVDILKADTITGSVTATTSSYIRVDGEQVYVSAKNVNAPTIGKTDGYTYTEDEYTYYLDFYGNALMAVRGKIADVETKYIYVVDFASQKYNSGTAGDLLGNGAGGSKDAAARVRVVDPETGDVSVKDLAIVTVNNKYYYAKPNGASSGVEVDDTAKVADKFVGSGQAKFFKYADISEGTIALDIDPANAVTVEAGVTLKKGTATVKTGMFANSSTVAKTFFYDRDNAKATLSTYTGYANFPSTQIQQSAVVVKNTNGTVSKIYMALTDKPVAEKTFVPMAVYMGEGEYDGTHHYFFSVAGVQTEYVNEEVAGVSKLDTAKVGEVFTLTSENNVLSDVTKVDASKTAVEVLTVESEYIVVAMSETSNDLVSFSKDYAVVDSEDDYAAAELEVGDYVTVYNARESDGNVTNDAALIVIVPAPEAE